MDRHYLSRPAVWISFSCFGALLASAILPLRLLPWISLAFLFISGLLFLKKVHWRTPEAPVILLSAAAAFAVYSVLTWFTVLPTERYVGNTYRIQAEILSDCENRYGNMYYTARVLHVEDTNQDTDFRIRLSHSEALDAEIDDIVHCTVRFHTFEDRFGLSSRTSQLAGRKVLGAYIRDYESISVQPAARHSFRFYFSALRAGLNDQLRSALSKDEAAVLSAMLLGLQSDLSDELRSAYTGAGASHILVISGMHMAIISNFVLSAFLFLRLRRRLAAAISVIFILLFMAISGFSVSVIRSGIMQILLLLGIFLGRNTDTLNSLAVALLVLMITNPFCVADISLLLSFSSTFGIIVFSPQILRLLTGRIQSVVVRNGVTRLVLPFVSSISAVAGSLPIQLFVFGTINLSSVLSSLLVLYISAWLVRIGALAILFLGIPVFSGASAPFLLVSGILARLQNQIIFWVSDHFPLQLTLSGSYLPGTVLVLIVFLLLAQWLYREKPLPILVYCLSAVLLFSGAFLQRASFGQSPKLVTADVGYAQCTALIHGNRAVVLQCSGSGEKAASILKDFGVREISLLHFGPSETEIRCAEDLLLDLPTTHVLLLDSVYYNSPYPYSVYTDRGLIELDDGISAQIAENGDRIDLIYGDLKIVLEQNDAVYLSETADILITDNPTTRMHAPLTILRTEESLETHLEHLHTGRYLLTSEHPVICLALQPDGTYTTRQG